MMEAPAIALARNGVLHVVMQDGAERIWYTSCQLNLSSQQVSLIESPATTVPIVLPTPTPTPLSFVQPRPTISFDKTHVSDLQPSIIMPLWVGAIPALVVVSGVALIYQMRRRR